ncbi:hypothetical protein ABTC85_15495 [Acinetobacter baumannii]|nr:MULTISPECIES: hypothetical protein [Acinetobacter calcoaceticus/baumannii complex]AGQ12288.1 hypothetical protein BJAB0868_p0031 [Acinetobacter baumannii BJAB0868]AGQ16149.1 hypothetical protein BJAB07104_p0021 [Acinetobacter baumannii BJAB07104]APF45719.1 hypothetical protein BKJ37_19470 [Acinetobacter baumannii]APM50960.1 hypothetical protein BS615_19795 [Acinetobacter baumannii]KPA49021.1 hypothetical protein AC795_09870 [Acinetobacter baumannii]
MKNTQGKELNLILGDRYASVQEVLDSKTNLNGTVASWNLKALDSIHVIDSINDDQKRNEIAFKRKRKNNVITWALIGGVLDASSGEDSILDGVLLGGLFGYASSGSVEKPEASILLTFTNGDKLGLYVNQNELLKIMEVQQEDNLIDGKKIGNLTVEQQQIVIESRRNDEFFNQLLAAVIMLIGIGLFNFLFGEDVKQEVTHGALLLYIANIGGMLCFIYVVLYATGVIGNKTDEEFKKPNEK